MIKQTSLKLSKDEAATQGHLGSGFVLAGTLLLAAAPSLALAGSSWSNPGTWSAIEPQNAARVEEPAPQQQSLRRLSDRRSRDATAPFAPESQNVALSVGQVFLMGDLASKFENNLGYQLDYTYGVSPMFGFASSLGFSTHGYTGNKSSYSQVNLQTGLRANLNAFDKVMPYGKIGLGFYRPSLSVNGIDSTAGLLFGFHLGAGVDLQLSNRAFFGAELTFHDIFSSTERTPNGLVTLGGSYTAFLAHVGIVL